MTWQSVLNLKSEFQHHKGNSVFTVLDFYGNICATVLGSFIIIIIYFSYICITCSPDSFQAAQDQSILCRRRVHKASIVLLFVGMRRLWSALLFSCQHMLDFHVFFLPTYPKLLLVNRALLNFWWPSLDFPHITQKTFTDTVMKLCVYIYQNSLSLRKSIQYNRTKGELNLCQISKIDTV